MLALSVLIGAILLAALCTAAGFFLRRALDVGSDRLGAADPMLGFAAGALITLWTFRITGSLPIAAITGIAALVLWAGGLAVHRFALVIERPGPAAAIVATFVVAVASVYLPMTIGAGTAFSPPPVYDLPKQILAVTALAHSAWPPENPFFPDSVFAYNYLFYLPAAAAAGIEPRAVFIALPALALGVTALMLWLTVEVGGVVGATQRWVVALFATWAGGLTPLMVGTPGFGHYLYLQKWISHELIVDEPFISAVFVPQHVYAIAAILAAIWLMAQTGALWCRLTCALIVAASGALSSLVLLPHVSLAFAIAALVAARGRQIVSVAAAGIAYAAIILPFLIDATGWQEHPARLVAPADTVSLLVFIAACGPVLLFAAYGAWLRIARRDGTAITLALVIVLALLFTLFVRYPDSTIKSTMLFRMLLPPLAAVGLLALWSRSSVPVRAALAMLLAGGIAINAPTVWWFASHSWSPRGAAERAFIEQIRQRPGRLLIDGDDQVIAALAVRPLLMDFRTLRRDAYLPANQRARYAALFDGLKTGDAAATSQALCRVTGVVSKDVRRWTERLGAPKIAGLGHAYFDATVVPAGDECRPPGR